MEYYKNSQNNAAAKLRMLKLGECLSCAKSDQAVLLRSQNYAILMGARFGGNDATKKTQKALLKQQYENFNATSSESLDSIFNRLQKLVIRSAILV
ncbi:hypothetical protein Tco_1408652 [Tanacetum coccineum]